MTTLLRRMWKNQSKHKKLCEELALADCEEAEGWWGGDAGAGAGVARYAGAGLVERAASAPATARAVASALHVAKASNRKMRRVKLSITARGVTACDADTDENVLNLSIYRISFCSADAASARVFAVVEGAASAVGGDHTAHVFVCSRRKHARSFALALAHAFNDAYLAWQEHARASPAGSGLTSPAPLDRQPRPAAPAAPAAPAEPWVSFGDDSDSESDECGGEGVRRAGWDDDIQPAPLLDFD